MLLYNENSIEVLPLTEGEAAFLNYYYIKFGNVNRAKEYIDERAKNITIDINCFHRASFWLWILGEYTNKTKELSYIEEHAGIIQISIEIIEKYWMKNMKHWLFSEREREQREVFISNIAIAYGALQAISNNYKSTAQRVMLDIKKAIYENFLDGGKVVSQKNKMIKGDLSIIAVPFGLLDAGNQILVESMNALEKNLLGNKIRYSEGEPESDELTLLLSWYYAERGEIARSKNLLSIVENSWKAINDLNAQEETISGLASILLAIAKADIEQKQFMDDLGTETILKHIPCGFQNPYKKENYERLPNYPIEDEEVVLNLVVHPIKEDSTVYILNKVEGKENCLEMQLKKSEAGEEYYSATIGNFKYKDIVEYTFVVKDTIEVKSEQYRFEVRKWLPLGSLTSAKQEKDIMILQFDGLKETSKCINFNIEKNNRNLKFDFYITEFNNFDNNEKNSCKLEFETYSLALDIDKMTLEIYDLEGLVLQSYHINNLIEMLCDSKGSIYKLKYNFNIGENEKFFGMGERFLNIEYRGMELDNYVFNQYRDQGLKTYMPVPFTISSGGYGIYLDSAYYSIFRFGSKNENVFELETELGKDEQSVTLYIFNGSPKNILSDFIFLTKKMEMVPKWALGPWMSSNNWDSQEEVLKQVNLTIKYKIPATVIVIEQWSDEATFYIFNDAQYEVKDGKKALGYNDFTFEQWGRWPSPKNMVDYLHDNAIKVLLWQAPVMKYMDGLSHAQRDEDERVMLERDYHVKKLDGKPYRIPYYEWFKNSLVPDFTNREAAAWWMSKREYLLKDIGIDGFKTDGGECIYNEDTVFSGGKTGAVMRNLYPNYYVKSYYDYANSYKKTGAITFSRAGYTGAQGTPMQWAGDERSTFEAFRATIRAGLSSSLSGILFWGWDLGGFNGEIPSAELYLRGAEMATFCPVMQYHAETKGEYNRDRTPWNIANRTNCPQVIEVFRKYANLRMNLLPYIYHQAILSIALGIPMMRAMFLEYPSDNNCIDMTAQYFFGDSLLVAPIINEGLLEKSVYLPRGFWCDLFTRNEILGGKTITVKTKLDEIPVFIKADSIIPLNLSSELELCSDVGSSVNCYENLTFLIYLKEYISFNFSDDLGNSIKIIATCGSEKIIITTESNYLESISLIVIGIRSKDNILVNNESNYDYILKENVIIIRM